MTDKEDYKYVPLSVMIERARRAQIRCAHGYDVQLDIYAPENMATQRKENNFNLGVDTENQP